MTDILEFYSKVGDNMLVQPYSDDSGVDVMHDLHRVWNECIVSILGEVWIVEHLGVYKREMCMVIRCLSSSKRKKRVVSFTHSKLLKDYPELGYFNVGGSAMYLSRKVSRQWKQGLHQNTVLMKAPFSKDIEQAARVNMWRLLGVDVMNHEGFNGLMSAVNVFKHEYPTYNHAMFLLEQEEMLSVALSNEVALALHPANGEVHVMYHNEPVGAIDRDGTLALKDKYVWIEDTLRGLIV